MNNASTNTLNKVKIKLRNLSKELLQVWNQRQNITALQQMTVDAFGKIHDQLDPAQYCQKTHMTIDVPMDNFEMCCGETSFASSGEQARAV